MLATLIKPSAYATLISNFNTATFTRNQILYSTFKIALDFQVFLRQQIFFIKNDTVNCTMRQFIKDTYFIACLTYDRNVTLSMIKQTLCSIFNRTCFAVVCVVCILISFTF